MCESWRANPLPEGTKAARKSAFPPVAAPDTRLLILGSLPGEASLAASQYYAHPRNQFWLLVGAVIGDDRLPVRSYDGRITALRGARVGLWDVIASARREGSLDTSIRDAAHAPLEELVSGLPALRAVAFNGGTAARIGRKQLGDTTISLIDLPSSSPAYAAMPFADKRRQWLNLQQFLA